MENGIEGFLNDTILDFEQVLPGDKLDALLYTPGAYLGSCRYKLPESLEDPVYPQLFKKFEEMNIGYFQYIGGNDSMDTVSKLSRYTSPIPNPLFRFIKAHTPGPYTFILNANNAIPKLFQSKKKTIGIRVPDNLIACQIVEALGEPLLNTSIDAPEDESEYITDPEAIHQRYGKAVDLVIDGGIGEIQYSTVLDCTQDEITVIRQGIGPL